MDDDDDAYMQELEGVDINADDQDIAEEDSWHVIRSYFKVSFFESSRPAQASAITPSKLFTGKGACVSAARLVR